VSIIDLATRNIELGNSVVSTRSGPDRAIVIRFHVNRSRKAGTDGLILPCCKGPCIASETEAEIDTL
jgi:hypothetical protein